MQQSVDKNPRFYAALKPQQTELTSGEGSCSGTAPTQGSRFGVTVVAIDIDNGKVETYLHSRQKNAVWKVRFGKSKFDLITKPSRGRNRCGTF